MQLREFLANIARASLVLGAVTASAFVTADDMYYGNNGGWSNGGFNGGFQQDCCAPHDCCAPAPCCEAPNYPWGFNPPAHQKCGCNPCGGGFLDNLTGRVDFLWWRPNAEGTSLGYEETFSSAGSASVLANDTTHNRSLNFKYDAGFRLGLGYYCPSNCWDIALNWTHFHSKAKAEGFSDPSNGVYFYNSWDRFFGFFADEAKERWSLDLDLIDLEFAQKFYVNHCFVLRPHFGLRFARIDQNVHVESNSSTAQENSPFNYASFTSEAKAKNDFRGVGPRIGLDVEINLGCNVLLFGKGAASLVYGEFSRNGEQYSTFVSFDDDTTTGLSYEAKGNSERGTVSMTDISIGLKWEHCFECCNVYHPFSLAFAWEQNAFYDLNDFGFIAGAYPLAQDKGVYGTNNTGSKAGHLTTQGLTITATIGF